jgi:hypothetical protein
MDEVIQVRTQDGKRFRVEQVLLDPESFQPAYLVLKWETGDVSRLLVPASLVAEFHEDHIVLDLPSELLDGFPVFEG